MKQLTFSTIAILFVASIGLAQSQSDQSHMTKAQKIAAHKKKHKKNQSKPRVAKIHVITKKSSQLVEQPAPAYAQSQSAPLEKQFNTLGDNQVFVDRVQNMDDDRKVRIVQNRTVDLDNRLEIGGNYGIAGGGDSYINSSALGALVEYHFNPHWSVGIRYEHFSNTLTSEGKNYYSEAQASQAADPASSYKFPEVDAPKNSEMLTASFSPIYGKLNLFDMGVAHFDIYTMLGYGKIQLLSGNSDTMAAGGGMALWLSQHFATRLEVRYQTYKDMIGPTFGSINRRENTIQGMASIGVLL